MKKLLFLLLLLTATQLNAQCNIVATAMGTTVDCYGDCNGTITYMYQNTGAPGAPYMVSLLNQTTGNWSGPTTYMNEFETIVFSNLCAGDYLINIQGNSCSQQTFATVSQQAPLQLNVNTVDPFQGSNGGATIYTAGGTPPYTYSIDGGVTFQGNNAFSGLTAGTYVATVMDDNGCTTDYTFVLNDIGNCNMVVTAQGGQSSCNNYCDATIQFAFTGSGLNGPFTINLENANGQVVQTLTGNNYYQGVFQNVCAGNYTVVVTDANGCAGSYQVSVLGSTPPQITNVATTLSVYGTATGTATVTISGGATPYNYSIDNGITWQASNVFTGLSAGFYIVYAQDANGCQSIFCFIVEETNACNLALNSTATTAACYGSNSASITYFYSNATGPVTIVLQDVNGGMVQSQTDANGTSQGAFNNVSAGTYYVIVTDAAGCTVTNTVTVVEPTAQIYLTAQSTPVTNGSSDGTITAVASGGTAPYQYSLDGIAWQASNLFTGLSTGVYIVYVQDANGCSSLITVQLTQISNCNQLIVPSIMPVQCYGGSSGSIFYNFTSDGSGAPYVVSLESGNNTIQSFTHAFAGGSGNLTNLPSGTYELVLTGSNGCVSTVSVYIDEPDPILISNVVVTDATAAMSNGSAVVTVTGGTAPFSYTLNNGTAQSSNLFTGLSAGVQILEVEDANGCTTIYCFIVNETAGCQPLAITANIAQSITCNGACNGALIWTYTSGGTAGTYVVSLQQNGTVIGSQSFAQSAYQGSFPNLCAGDYSVVVTDPAGCSASYNNTLVEPELISLAATTVSATQGSSNGSITVSASGGTGNYLYSLDAINWQASNVFNGLTSGVYIVYVQDSNGCQNLLTVIVDDAINCSMVVTAQPTMVSGCGNTCNGEVFYSYVNSGGTAPFTIILQDQNGNTWTQSQTPATATGNFTGLCPGVYIVTVTDANGCTGIYTVQIVGPSNLTVNANVTDPTFGNSDGSFTLNTSGGSPSYEFSIDNQATWTSNNAFTGLSAGVYVAYVKDQGVCTQVTSVKLGQSVAEITELASNLVVYPNPTKGFIFIEGENTTDLLLHSLDGAVVPADFEQFDGGWKADLSNVASGVYFVSMNLDGVLKTNRIIVE